VTVSPDGNGVRITVDSVADDRSYVNFLHTQATVVTPDQQQTSLELPQVAPGRYEAEVPAAAEGPYFLNIIQQGPDGQAQVSRPAGFVVPYSPEYRTLRPNPELLAQLARVTGGRQLTDPLQTFDHSIPAGGSPREIWPLLVTLAAFLFLFDVALRRLRLALLDLRRSVALAAARLLGRAQEVAAPAQARLLAAKSRIVVETPTLSGRPGPPQPRGTGAEAVQAPISQPASASALSNRLLEAKKRAKGAG